MRKSGGDGYFDLGSVVESSKLFGYGKIPYRVLGKWHYPASQIYKIRILGSDTNIVFVKLLNRNDDEISKHKTLIENEFNVLHFMHEECDSTEVEYGVVEPLERIESRLALITKGEEGQRLDRILLKFRPFRSVNEGHILKGMVAVGGWLRRLFESTKVSQNDSGVKERICGEIGVDLKTIQDYRKSEEWVRWAKILIDCFNQLINSIDRSALRESLCHGDFIPGNVLLGRNGRIVVLDLTDSTRGIVYNDLANFWQWLDDLGRRRPWYREREIEQMKGHLLKGFFCGEIPSTLVDIFVIKTGIGKIRRIVQKESGSFLEDFMRGRRVDYLKRKLIRIAEDGRRAIKEG